MKTSMSEAPISAPSARTLAALARGGWATDDWFWEKHTERAAQRLEAHGDPAAAAADWRAGLALARDRFARHDPRLACSLTNHAAALAHTGRETTAERLLAEAMRVWRAAQFWVATMRLETPARSSIYHLRMELRHLDTYRNHQRNHHLAVLRAGEAATRAHAANPANAPRGPDLEAWAVDAPAGYSDARKLAGAVYLLAHAPDADAIAGHTHPDGAASPGAPAFEA